MISYFCVHVDCNALHLLMNDTTGGVQTAPVHYDFVVLMIAIHFLSYVNLTNESGNVNKFINHGHDRLSIVEFVLYMILVTVEWCLLIFSLDMQQGCDISAKLNCCVYSCV